MMLLLLGLGGGHFLCQLVHAVLQCLDFRFQLINPRVIFPVHMHIPGF